MEVLWPILIDFSVFIVLGLLFYLYQKRKITKYYSEPETLFYELMTFIQNFEMEGIKVDKDKLMEDLEFAFLDKNYQELKHLLSMLDNNPSFPSEINELASELKSLL